MATLHVLEVAGRPRERGRAHGEGLRTLVRERDRRWRATLGEATGAASDRFIERFLAETRFVRVVEAWAPGLLDEVRGIAEGADLPYDAVLAAQFMDEEWWFVERFKGAHHCSSLGARDGAGGRALAAQTMDLVTWTDGLQALLRMRDERGGETFVLTMAGMIGLCGATPGLALCVNTLGDLRSRDDGLPVAFVTRTVLAQGTRAAAVDFLRRVPHASGQNYVVADATGVTDLECSAAGAAEAKGRGDAVWHTNHAVASADRAREPDETTPGRRNSRCRLASLDGRLGGTPNIDGDTAKRALAAHDDAEFPVSIPAVFARERGKAFFTFAGVVWEVGEGAQVHVAPGAPCTEAWQTFAFSGSAARAAAE